MSEYAGHTNLVEGHPGLGVRVLTCALGAGSQKCLEVTWSESGRILAKVKARPEFVGPDADAVSIVMGVQCAGSGEEEGGTQRVVLDRTPCHFGGSRVWFLCPRCSCRVAFLYLVDDLFLCRHCHGLVYVSTTLPRLERLARRIARMRATLGDFRPADAFGLDPIPARPHGMHRATYERLTDHLLRAEMEYHDSVRGWIRRLLDAS